MTIGEALHIVLVGLILAGGLAVVLLILTGAVRLALMLWRGDLDE